MTVDLRIGLLAVADDEPSLLAWRNILAAEGVPYDIVIVGDQTLTMERLQHSADHGRYQALILTTDRLVRQDPTGYVSALTPEEWLVLEDYQISFGIRQLGAYATPSQVYGLASPTSGGEVGGTRATLTPEGHVVFPELRGAVPLSTGTYGMTTHLVGGVDCTVLVVGADSSPILCAVVHEDGREQLVMTIASGPHSQHMHLLGHGILNWLTRGRRLGHRDFYLSVQVDDVLLSAARTTADGRLEDVRMQPADVTHAAAWSAQSGLRLDLTFNGWGAVKDSTPTEPDQLAVALLENVNGFGWVNHTFGHLDLDHRDSAEISLEISENLRWAATQQIPVAPDSLVTGAHSGLMNPALGPALDTTGVRWVATDASRPDQVAVQVLGSAHPVPRHPVNIPLWVTTRHQLVQAKAAGALSLPEAPTTSIDSQAAFGTEAAMMLTHVLTNDPRPHFVHQNALTGDRLLLELLDMVGASYLELVVAPLTQPNMAEAGSELLRRDRWSQIIASGAVSASSTRGRVDIANLSAEVVEVPVSLFNEGAAESAGWVMIAAGDRVSF